MLASDQLRAVPLTVHIPLRDVPRSITRALIIDTVRTTWEALCRDFGMAQPRIAVAGLNPHAGESGTIGREEVDTIIPAIAELRAEGLAVTGPFPADTLFHAAARREYDAVVAMYHDQALIPLKTLAFDSRRQRHAGLALRAHVARPRHRLRHCRPWQGQSGKPDTGAAHGAVDGHCSISRAEGPIMSGGDHGHQARRQSRWAASPARRPAHARPHRQEEPRPEFHSRPQSDAAHRACGRSASGPHSCRDRPGSRGTDTGAAHRGRRARHCSRARPPLSRRAGRDFGPLPRAARRAFRRCARN